MRWRSAHTVILLALTLFILGAAPWLVGAATRSGDSPFPAAAQAADRPAPPALDAVVAVVGATPVRAPLPAGFLGLSLEYGALDAYTGGNPAALNPVFVRLVRNLAPAPGQPLLLRIGGDSTDATWWPVRGVARPAGIRYALTPRWAATARALATALNARLILGINLAADRPSCPCRRPERCFAASDRPRGCARTRQRARRVRAVSLVHGTPRVRFRPRRLVQPERVRQAGQTLGAGLPKVPLAGPATAKLPWIAGLPALVHAAPRLKVVTVHRYALKGCQTDPDSPDYPSIANLLSDRSASGLARPVAPYVAAAHARGLEFRVDELNSAALAGCLGRTGVSDTFASAPVDARRAVQHGDVGVDGVNVHSLPGAAYAPFTFTRVAGRWRGSVRPDYYGMLMFARAFPPGARLLPVHVAGGPVKVWATPPPPESS